jgi:transposase
LTIGPDLGDRSSCYCVLDEESEVIGRGVVATEQKELEALFGKLPASVVALEVGTHSPWVSRLLEKWGHERS